MIKFQHVAHSIIPTICILLKEILVVMMVLPDPFRGMGAWRNSTETQQSGHAPRSGPEVKNGRSSAEDGTGAP